MKQEQLAASNLKYLKQWKGFEWRQPINQLFFEEELRDLALFLANGAKVEERKQENV